MPGGVIEKRKCGGRGPYQKGFRLENSTRNYFKDRGLSCRRIPLSGAGEEKGDLVLTTSWGQTLKIECKSRKVIAKWIVEALGDHDAIILKQDRGETLVMLRLPLFADMAQ
jgi:Holliday junction resolvase